MAFYETKNGQVGAVFSNNYAGGNMGSLNSFPYIQLSGDAGVGATGGNNEETLRITKLDDLAQLYICTINFTEAKAKQNTAFNRYDARVLIVDDRGEAIAVPLDSETPGTVAIIAKIDNTGFMGPRLINENYILDLPSFQETIPGAKLLQISSKIVLKKKGDRSIIPINDLHATLTWKADVDLDFHAYYQTKITAPQGGNFWSKLLGGGSGKPGEEGHVYFACRGNKTQFPWIYLDQDAGVGDKGGDNQENLYFTTLEHIEHLLIVANIFNKPNAIFSRYDGQVIIIANGNSFEVPLTATEPGSNCIIAHIDNSGAQPLLININKVQDKSPTIASFLN
jgi:uncharacterized protein involved in tellurium resistance